MLEILELETLPMTQRLKYRQITDLEVIQITLFVMVVMVRRSYITTVPKNLIPQILV